MCFTCLPATGKLSRLIRKVEKSYGRTTALTHPHRAASVIGQVRGGLPRRLFMALQMDGLSLWTRKRASLYLLLATVEWLISNPESYPISIPKLESVLALLSASIRITSSQVQARVSSLLSARQVISEHGICAAENWSGPFIRFQGRASKIMRSGRTGS